MTIETGNSIIVQEKYIDRLGGSPEVKLLIDTMYTEMSFVGYDQERALFFYYSRSKVMVFGVGGAKFYAGECELNEVRFVEFMKIGSFGEDPGNLLASNSTVDDFCVAVYAGEQMFLFEIDKKTSKIVLYKKIGIPEQILAMKHDSQSRCLICLSREGKITFCRDNTMVPSYTVNMIWNRVTAGHFLNSCEMLGGFENGEVQYIK